MLQDDLEIGKYYAYRMTAKHDDTDLVKVQVLSAGRKGKIRVRYEEGEYTGLDEWVRSKQIACRWAQRRNWLRDHEHKLRLDQADAEAYDKVVYDAIDFVMEASGEYTGYMLGEAQDPAVPQRFWARAKLDGLPLDADPANYVDRFGSWHLSFRSMEAASIAFAAAEPEAVELYLRKWEDQLKAEGFQPGGRVSHDVLRQWSPSMALARSWTRTAANKALEDEVQRLQRLVHEAIRLLKTSGNERGAARIERGLHGG